MTLTAHANRWIGFFFGFFWFLFWFWGCFCLFFLVACDDSCWRTMTAHAAHKSKSFWGFNAPATSSTLTSPSLSGLDQSDQFHSQLFTYLWELDGTRTPSPAFWPRDKVRDIRSNASKAFEALFLLAPLAHRPFGQTFIRTILLRMSRPFPVFFSKGQKKFTSNQKELLAISLGTSLWWLGPFARPGQTVRVITDSSCAAP